MEDDINGMVPLTDPKEHSVGGVWGHLLRRGVHLGMVAIPWVYYEHAANLADRIGMNTAEQFASALVILLIVAEAVRLRTGITVFGQRDYEATQVSALAWGALAGQMIGCRWGGPARWPKITSSECEGREVIISCPKRCWREVG